MTNFLTFIKKLINNYRNVKVTELILLDRVFRFVFEMSWKMKQIWIRAV